MIPILLPPSINIYSSYNISVQVSRPLEIFNIPSGSQNPEKYSDSEKNPRHIPAGIHNYAL